tara:strand:+ start:399 stop:569 length:171 start_codon:yes stop_codon:yes gene_type:complete
MEDTFEDYLDDVIEIAEEQYDISKDEIVYNDEHFRHCYNDGTDANKAVMLLSNFCI